MFGDYAIVREWNSILAINGQSVPLVVTYYDKDLNEQVVVAGSTEWLYPNEKVMEVGYTTRQVLFTALDKNFTSNNDSQVFDIQVKVKGSTVVTGNLIFEPGTFTYNTFLTIFIS